MKTRYTTILKYILFAAIPAVAALLAYGGVTDCDFIGLDDDLYVYENPIVCLGLTGAGIRWAFSAFYASTWQPLVWLSYLIDVSCGGVNPAVFHRTNLILHLLNIVLLYACWTKLTRRPRLAAIVALLFAIHPLHVESVAWIAERKDVLSTLFWWTAVLAYTGYVKMPTPTRYGAVLAALVLGLMAKPMLMTLPIALLLLDVWPLRRVSLSHKLGWKSVLIEKAPMLIPVLISLIITIYVQARGESILDVETISLWARFSNASVSIWRYIGKLIYPVSLSVLYPHPGSWPALATLASLTATLSALAVAWCQRERRPWLLFGISWFLITLLPVIGIIQIGWHAMADRFTYIPAIGIYVIAAYALAESWHSKPQWRYAVGITTLVAILALIARTHSQVSLWHNSMTLFSHAANVTTDNWMMHNGVGAALSREGRNDEAGPHFETVIRIKPDRPKAYYNLGHVRFAQKRWAEAAALFQKSIDLYPTDKALFNLAVAHAKNGNSVAAEQAYRTLIQRTPRHMPAIISLGNLCRETGRFDKAVVIFQQALAIEPDNLNAQTALGQALLDSNRTVEALKVLVQVLEKDPSNPEARKAVMKAMMPVHSASPETIDPVDKH